MVHYKNTFLVFSLSLFIAIMSLVGCGSTTDSLPQLGTVSGIVTLNGHPLKGISVTFIPQLTVTKARPSRAITDENGKFKLNYNSETDGAILGKHIVQFSKREGGDAAGIETLPSQFNTKSKITKTVKEGDNNFTFELKMK